MNDLFEQPDSLRLAYADIYEQLGELREEFHRSGRLDDSNAKLDEVSKLFAAYIAYRTNEISAFPDPADRDVVSRLQRAVAETIKLPQYTSNESGSVFGHQPGLALRDADSALASNLVRLVRNCVDTAFGLRAVGKPFDVLNEAFGHFVRDNFRNNVEDAQYMTPPEVVEFMAAIALHDIISEDPEARNPEKHWTVLDPTCGVGSFLTAVYTRAKHSNWLNGPRLRLYGQDKVERMVRLARINLAMFDSERHEVSIGNSLALGSPIDSLNGQVDLILTNPPFGAQFDSAIVNQQFGGNTPFFSTLRGSGRPLDSELLFVDRNLKLLRDGGRLLIIVPDGVVSGKGAAAILRRHVASTATLRALIELPAVTFAQAGTRTKTAILYLEKGRESAAKRPSVFCGIASSLGFQVTTRKGAQVKVAQGANELETMLKTYVREVGPSPGSVEVISDAPSCVRVSEKQVHSGSWTPNHYSARRFKTVTALQQDADLSLVSLGDLVDFFGDRRKPAQGIEGHAYISVLHILGEGFVDVSAVYGNCPRTPGTPVEPGEILLSRINPRIPRVCVIPDFGVPILCSSEFEVMQPKGQLSAYQLAFVLQSRLVQDQICSLTSGTSASHNRIRTDELAQVLIPVPKSGSRKARRMLKLANEYENALKAIIDATFALARLRNLEKALLNSEINEATHEQLEPELVDG